VASVPKIPTGTRLSGCDPCITLKETDMSEKDLKHIDTQLKTAVDQARGEAYNDAYAESYKEGVKSVRIRAKEILTQAIAKQRWQLALSLVVDTELTVEQVVKILAAAPQEKGNYFTAIA